MAVRGAVWRHRRLVFYPYGGDKYDASAFPPQQTGTERPLPPDVGSYPRGDTPTGLKDMLGLVWQWTSEFTDAHTRAGLVRGGSYYTAVGSGWYFPNKPNVPTDNSVSLVSHGKLLLMAPAYDRHGTVGFRCVADGPPLPPPPTCTPGVDHPNGDLAGMPLYNTTAHACGSLCNATVDCGAWVFIGAACLNPPNPSLCYLKAGTPPSVPAAPCFCSGTASLARTPPSQ